jgi:hypothetical protein
MRIAILVVAFGIPVAASLDARAGDAANVVLPNPRLIGSKLESVGCARPDCLELWRRTPQLGDQVYPTQLRLDIAAMSDAGTSRKCVRGLLAIYDEATDLALLQSVVDGQYAKWATADNGKSPVKLWRVEPEGPNGLVVQLRISEEGLMLIYQPIGGPCR